MSNADDEDRAKTCFVAMPITTPAAYAEELGDPEHFAHVLTHLFTPALQAAGLTVIPPSVAGSEIIHAEIIKNLEQADFVLCDLSDLNPNVLFELGIRTSLDRPVILVKDNKTSRIPFDINAINTATYEGSLTPWSLAAEIPRLTTFIQDVVNNGNPRNAMWRYFGLTKRGAPSEAGANPVEDKLDLIIRELAKQGPFSSRGVVGQVGVWNQKPIDPREIAVRIEPIMARHGIHGFSVSPEEMTSTGIRKLVIGMPRDAKPDQSLEKAVTEELRDLGEDVWIVWSPLD